MGVINSVTKKFWLNFNPHPPSPVTNNDHSLRGIKMGSMLLNQPIY